MEWPGHMAYASCKTAHAVVNALFNEAVHDRYIAENPLPPFSRMFGSRPATPITDKIRVIPAHELASILDTADATLPRIYGALFLFLARTGCRLGEALGLDWDAVNLIAQTAEIRATYSAHYGLGSPKSGRARTVALSPALVHRLADLKQSLEKDAWQQGKPMPDAVFITPRTRNRIAPDLVRKQWKACLRKLGLPGYRPHDLRHTFASQLLANGESVKTVQMALGHHSAKITLDVYGHLMPDRPYPDVAALDASPNRTRRDNQQAGS
jgi:integrase